MRRKNVATFCLLFAWLCATGAVSDLAQVFAWGRMFVGYTRALPMGEALTETFDAAKPCELCLAVKKTRATEDGQSHDATLAGEKLFLVCSAAPAPVVVAPPATCWPDASDWHAVARTEPVRTRPPRV